MHYKYCPKCGTKLIDKNAGDDGAVPFCEHCNKFWFDSFASCVIVLTYNQFDEVVLSRQSYLSDKYSSFTSGYITPGETAETTAAREVKEELGIDIKNLAYAGTCWFEKGQMLMHGFICFLKKCDFKLSSEVDSASWVGATKAHEFLFPDSPGNAAFMILRKFLKKRGLPMV